MLATTVILDTLYPTFKLLITILCGTIYFDVQCVKWKGCGLGLGALVSRPYWGIPLHLGLVLAEFAMP